MMKKSWKNRSGVSPVIATILMVAITVVLAAVLYVMVMGFGGGSGSTATGVLTPTKTGTAAGGSSIYTVTLSSISKNDVLPADTKVVVTPLGTAPNNVNRTDGALGTQLSYALVGSTHVTAGDYCILQLPKLLGGSYTVSLLYVPTGNNIASTTIVVS